VIHQNHRIRTAVAVALAAGAVAPAGASAMLPRPDPVPPPKPVPVHVSSGFDWGDAGIGAAGALGLSIIAAGGIVFLGRRGPHGPTGATA
jgi:hypothetical protein